MNIRKGFEMRDLADHLSITNVYLSKLLRDNSPRHLEGMASFYGVVVSEFIREGEND